VGDDLPSAPTPDAGPALPPPIDMTPVSPPVDTAPPADTMKPPPDMLGGAYGTPYPACPASVHPTVSVRPGSCYGGDNTGRCRTSDGYVCTVCEVTAPCAFLPEPGMTIKSMGPSCDRGRVCVPVACPIREGGAACTVDPRR
jgi:hypothetical protein